MSRLIDEEVVKRRMHETMDYQDLYLPVHFEMCMKDAPTIDAVQVVRCEDCKHAQHDVIFDQWWCKGREVTPDWYCKDGERKEQCKSD